MTRRRVLDPAHRGLYLLAALLLVLAAIRQLVEAWNAP